MKSEDIHTVIRDRVTIEPMTGLDIQQVALIENKTFKHPWKPSAFFTELERSVSICLVLRDESLILGYLIFWAIPPELHILNIAVHPEFQKRGLGSLLLSYLTEFGLETHCREIFLEVRPSNTAALALYHKMGFLLTGKRKNYYAEDKEDALLMTKYLSHSTH